MFTISFYLTDINFLIMKYCMFIVAISKAPIRKANCIFITQKKHGPHQIILPTSSIVHQPLKGAFSDSPVLTLLFQSSLKIQNVQLVYLFPLSSCCFLIVFDIYLNLSLALLLLQACFTVYFPLIISTRLENKRA